MANFGRIEGPSRIILKVNQLWWAKIIDHVCDPILVAINGLSVAKGKFAWARWSFEFRTCIRARFWGEFSSDESFISITSKSRLPKNITFLSQIYNYVMPKIHVNPNSRLPVCEVFLAEWFSSFPIMFPSGELPGVKVNWFLATGFLTTPRKPFIEMSAFSSVDY